VIVSIVIYRYIGILSQL